MKKRRGLLLGMAGMLVMGGTWGLEVPQGKVVLTISGRVAQTNRSEGAGLSMAMLEKLPQRTFRTRTPWYPEPVEFTGPLLRDVLALVGAQGNTLVAVALNDYKTEIPVQDAQQHDVVLARLMNGKPMPVRDKGPLFIVYPYDKGLDAEVYYNRSAWQLKQLTVK
ncbi:MAG: molybdopterin-dependent oxidoreductase [Rhodoferax sp.]